MFARSSGEGVNGREASASGMSLLGLLILFNRLLLVFFFSQFLSLLQY